MLLEIPTPIGNLTAYRPNLEEMQKYAPIAKRLFQEAFSITYREYHRMSHSAETIEKWLHLKEDFTLDSWLSNTFDEEYEDYVMGTKKFVFLRDSQGTLIAWLSHSLVSKEGSVYLSQCSLEAGLHRRGIASSAFAEVLKQDLIKEVFPEVKEITLITRKINLAARHLYIKAGFTMDETLDPNIYGSSYDDRYVGYRLKVF